MIKRSLGFSQNQVEGYSDWEVVKFFVFILLGIILFISIGVLVYYKVPYPSHDVGIISIPALISIVFVNFSMKQLEVENNKKSKSMFILAMVFLALGYFFLGLSAFVSTKTVDAVVVNLSRDYVLLNIDGKFERVDGVTNSCDLSIGDTVTSISKESKVTHFKSWTGATEDMEKKKTILK